MLFFVRWLARDEHAKLVFREIQACAMPHWIQRNVPGILSAQLQELRAPAMIPIEQRPWAGHSAASANRPPQVNAENALDIPLRVFSELIRHIRSHSVDNAHPLAVS